MVYRSSGYYKSLKLADGFYCYTWQGRGNNCNSCLFVNVLRGERPHVLIDPGHITNDLGEACFDYLVKSMDKDGFQIEDIGLIINTHSHPDHCEANEVIIKRNKAWVTLSEEEDKFRTTLGERLCSMLGMKAPQFTPLFYLTEGNLNLGTDNKVNLQIINTPGHSPGSICLYWPDNKLLISGDVVFYGSIGRTDFPGGSLSALKKSIDKLSQLDVEFLVPGHSTESGSIINGKQNIKHNFQVVRLFF